MKYPWLIFWLLIPALLHFTPALASAGSMAVAMPSNTLYLDASRSEVSLLAARRARIQAQSQAFDRLRALLVRKGAISPRAILPCLDSFVVSGKYEQAGPIQQTNDRRLQSQSLSFAYTGWTADEQAQLSTFLGDAAQGAYQKLVSLYGPPAAGGTLTIIKSSDVNEQEGGIFDAVKMTLQLASVPADLSTTDTTYAGIPLLHLVLHAFHAPAIIGFDAWEEGMARAAALVTYTLLHPEFDPTLDMQYLLPLYDTLNQPALACPSIFTAGVDYMPLWRIGMVTSAWLKLYAENSTGSIFKLFNAAYYAQYAGDPTAAGNLETLKSLMAGVLPSVEGEGFLTWYNQQYALQPTVQLGNRIYIFAVPLQENIPLILHYYNSSSSVDGQGHTVVTETPLSGTARFDFASWDGIALFPEEGYNPSIDYNTVTIPTGSDPGIGTLDPSFYNIGDPPTQRLRIKTTIAGLSVIIYYAYWSRGDDTNENSFFGSVVGADTGTLRIMMPGIALPDLQLTQGAFSVKLQSGSLTYFTKVRFDYISADNQTTSFYRDVGPGFYAPTLIGQWPQTAALSHSFLAGPSLVSFPLTPQKTDVAQLFSSTDPAFPFAWWDPTLAKSDKYRRYPDVPVIKPGVGYWLNLPGVQTGVNITGTTLTIDDPHTTTLQPGWNLIGNMYNVPLNIWSMNVVTGAASFSLMDALQKGIVSPIWMYDQTAKGYVINSSLDAWQGAWIANLTGGQLTLDQQNAASAATKYRGMSGASSTPDSGMRVDPISLLTDGGWGMWLQASTTHARDTMAYLGVSSKEQNIVNNLCWKKPPAMGNGVSVAFILPSKQSEGACYATDIRRNTGIAQEEWEFTVTCCEQDTVSLTWPNLRSIPGQYDVTLKDLTTGVCQLLRTTPEYSFLSVTATDHPDVRYFSLTITSRSARPPLIIQMGMSPVNGKLPGSSIRFQLSLTADVTAEVRTITGKLLRTIQLPATRAGEMVSIPWDNRNYAAAAYLVMLTARTSEGQVARQAIMVPSRR